MKYPLSALILSKPEIFFADILVELKYTPVMFVALISVNFVLLPDKLFAVILIELTFVADIPAILADVFTVSLSPDIFVPETLLPKILSKLALCPDAVLVVKLKALMFVEEMSLIFADSSMVKFFPDKLFEAFTLMAVM